MHMITSRGVTFPAPTTDEKHEQANGIRLIEAVGGKAYVLGTRRAMACGVCGAPSTDPSTRQTPGIGDVLGFIPPSPRAASRALWTAVWIEFKGMGGGLSPEQVEFRNFCRAAGLPHVVGGLDAVMVFLEAQGWIRPAGIPPEIGGTR